MAEYFRDVNEQAVPLFIDNIFRFAQTESEVSAFFLAGRMPMKTASSAVKQASKQASKPWVINWFFPAGQVSIGKNSRSITSIQAHLRMI
jgi:hypothetical protein